MEIKQSQCLRSFCLTVETGQQMITEKCALTEKQTQHIMETFKGVGFSLSLHRWEKASRRRRLEIKLHEYRKIEVISLSVSLPLTTCSAQNLVGPQYVFDDCWKAEMASWILTEDFGMSWVNNWRKVAPTKGAACGKVFVLGKILSWAREPQTLPRAKSICLSQLPTTLPQQTVTTLCCF